MKPVLISGAGLGGLLLARSLLRSGIAFRVFERDESVHVRRQGYRIRISSDGLNALKAILSTSEYEALHKGTAQTGGGGIHFLDAITLDPFDPTKPESWNDNKDGKQPGLGGDVLGISRGFLREQLIQGFEERIHWHKQVTGYEHTSDGVIAIFADGTRSEEGSILVGADGPQSRITKQLTNGKVRAYDTGARMIHGQTPARAFEQLGNGVWFLTDEKSVPGAQLGLITNVRPGALQDPDVELGWVFTGSPGTFDAPDGNFSLVGKAAADMTRSLTSKWHPKLQEIFALQNDAEAAFLKMTTALPDGIPDWENDPRVTIIGDAVHCMTPAGGVGANTALRDAELLGRLLSSANGWSPSVATDFEREMRTYAGENVKMSFDTASSRFHIEELT